MIMIDLNVILDVVQKREPHYSASAALLSRVIETELAAYLPGHAVTTLHYIVAKYSTKTQADELVDWLLRYFDIAAEGKAGPNSGGPEVCLCTISRMLWWQVQRSRWAANM